MIFRPLAPFVLLGATAALAGCSGDQAGAAAETEISQEAANKQLVLDMWHDVIDGRNIDAAPKYIASDYVQHSPGIPSGLDAVMAFLKTEFPDSKPLEPGSYPFTEFEFVIAEGDLVQLMFQRELPDRADPSKTTKVWWYDTYRVKDGQIVEHWDSAQDD